MTISNIVSIIGIVQGIFLALLLIPKIKKSTPALFAFLLITILVVDLLTYHLFSLDEIKFVFTRGFSESTLFLYGPALYFYVKAISKANTRPLLSKKHLLHLIPAVVIFFLLSPYFLRDYSLAAFKDLTQINYYVATIIEFLSWFSHLSIYLTACILILQRSPSHKNNIRKSKIHLALIKKIIWGYSFFVLISGLLYLLEFVFGVKFSSLEILNFLLVFHIFAICYIGFYNQSILGNNQKYRKSNLSSGKAELQLQTLLTYFEEERPYLDQELTQRKVAKHLNLLANHISQIVNDKLGKSFNDFVNEYRIDLAKKYLKDPNRNIYTVEAIAHQVGFRSKSAFYIAFKRLEGQTPSEYKANHK